MIADIISSVGGLVFPPIMDFVKKKFLGKNDSPEATLSSLAMASPEKMDSYVDAQAKLLGAKTSYFNRDVVGEPSRWVIDLRASIRPCFVIISLIIIGSSVQFDLTVPQSFMSLCEVCVGSWFGSRIK